jgi:TM2 domain-containing membrane protein YozV
MISTIKEKLVRFSLVCGIIAGVLYIATDILLATGFYPGFSIIDQTISELSAIGAPTRLFWVLVMGILFGPLVIAFGAGVRMVSQKRSQSITGILLMLWGISGYAWFFFPMHMRGFIGSTSDTGHLVMAAITVPLMILFIAFGAVTFGRKFSIYSIVTIILTLTFGAWTGTQAPAVAAMQPTPWLGIIERVGIYAPMIWILALAVVLLKVNKKTGGALEKTSPSINSHE